MLISINISNKGFKIVSSTTLKKTGLNSPQLYFTPWKKSSTYTYLPTFIYKYYLFLVNNIMLYSTCLTTTGGCGEKTKLYLFQLQTFAICTFCWYWKLLRATWSECDNAFWNKKSILPMHWKYFVAHFTGFCYATFVIPPKVIHSRLPII